MDVWPEECVGGVREDGEAGREEAGRLRAEPAGQSWERVSRNRERS